MGLTHIRKLPVLSSSLNVPLKQKKKKQFAGRNVKCQALNDSIISHAEIRLKCPHRTRCSGLLTRKGLDGTMASKRSAFRQVSWN